MTNLHLPAAFTISAWLVPMMKGRRPFARQPFMDRDP